MKPSPGQRAAASIPRQPAAAGRPRATSRLPHLCGHPSPLPSAWQSPGAHSRRLPPRYPASGHPGEQGREGSGRGRRGRPLRVPCPDTKAPSPTLHHLFRLGPCGWRLFQQRPHFSPQPLPPRPSPRRWDLPRQIEKKPLAARQQRKPNLRQGPGGPGSRAWPLTRAPGLAGSLWSAVGSRARALSPRRAGRRRERSEGASRWGERGSADTAPTPRRRLQTPRPRGSPSPLGSGNNVPPDVGSSGLLGSRAASRLLAAFREEAGLRAANGGPRGRTGGAAHPPRSWPGGRRCGLCAPLAAPPRPALGAPGSRARSTAHTPHTPTRSTPTPAREGARQPRRRRSTCAILWSSNVRPGLPVRELLSGKARRTKQVLKDLYLSEAYKEMES